MIIDNGKNQYQATAENAVYYRFPKNDILNGLYLDLDEDYLFISQHSEFFNRIITAALLEGIPNKPVHEFNPDEAPYIYMISHLGRFVATSAEDISHGVQPE